MTKRKQLLAAMAVAAPFMFAAPAHAEFIISGWTIDPSAADAGLPGPFTGVDQITFNAIVEADTDAVAVGSTYDVRVLGTATSLIGGGGIIGGTGLNDTWELTFEGDFQTVITGIAGDVIQFSHLAGGVLDFYLDDLTDGGQANTADAGTYTDGIFFAQFIDDGTGEGSINTSALDGQDDFSADLNPENTLSGVLINAEGEDLDREGTGMVVDSNFDLDPDDNNTIDTTYGALDCGASLASHCAEEDGSARLTEAQVPEPAVLGLLGLGLLGLGAHSLRRRNRA